MDNYCSLFVYQSSNYGDPTRCRYTTASSGFFHGIKLLQNKGLKLTISRKGLLTWANAPRLCRT